jgi:hypothetical protein
MSLRFINVIERGWINKEWAKNMTDEQWLKETKPVETETKATFKEWVLLELLGRQKIVGLMTEATLAGGAFLRVDVPAFDGAPAFTRFFSPSAVYSINPIAEEVARGLMERYRNEPVSRFELPQLADKVPDGTENPSGFERDLND